MTTAFSKVPIALCVALAAASSPTTLPAEIIASDSASDPAYGDGWQGLNGYVAAETGSDNGGFGFLPWDFEEDDAFWEADRSPYPTAHFIDTGPSSFNTLGAPAFALTT